MAEGVWVWVLGTPVASSLPTEAAVGLSIAPTAGEVGLAEASSTAAGPGMLEGAMGRAAAGARAGEAAVKDAVGPDIMSDSGAKRAMNVANDEVGGTIDGVADGIGAANDGVGIIVEGMTVAGTGSTSAAGSVAGTMGGAAGG